MNSSDTSFDRQWQALLETVGADLFLRYRKRWLEPGIVRDLRRDCPGMPILDALIRVYAARRLVGQGMAFHALEAVRSGRWKGILVERQQQRRVATRRQDRVSRCLVALGGGGFTGFCVLSLLSDWSHGDGQWLLAAALIGALPWLRHPAEPGGRVSRADPSKALSAVGGRGAMQ